MYSILIQKTAAWIWIKAWKCFTTIWTYTDGKWTLTNCSESQPSSRGRRRVRPMALKSSVAVLKGVWVELNQMAYVRGRWVKPAACEAATRRHCLAFVCLWYGDMWCGRSYRCTGRWDRQRQHIATLPFHVLFTASLITVHFKHTQSAAATLHTRTPSGTT